MKNVLVGQSGGPTAVINSSLAGVYETAKTCGAPHVYGMQYGIEGVLEGKLVDLDTVLGDKMDIELLKRTPSSFLGSCRHKLPDPTVDEKPFVQLFELFRQNDIGAVFYIGGNDSMDTISKLSAYGKTVNSEIRFIGVPKTIDNDLMLTDHTPGYGSAAKYIATILKEVICDSSVYDLRSVTVAEIMGRHTGWLAAAASLAAGPDCNGPDLILLPECPFDEEAFLKRVAELEKERHNVIIAVSEGVKNKDGVFLCDLVSTAGQLDAFGHKAILSGTEPLSGGPDPRPTGLQDPRYRVFYAAALCQPSGQPHRRDRGLPGRRRGGGGRHARRDRQDGRHQAPERPALPRRDRDGRCDEGREL